MNPIPTQEFDGKLKKLLAFCAKSKLSPSQKNEASSKLKFLVTESAILGLSNDIEEIGIFFLTRERFRELQQQVIFPTQPFLALAEKGLAASFQFGVTDSPESFSDLPIKDIFDKISSPQLLDKITKKRKSLIQEGIEFLLKYPELAIESSVTHWLIEKAKIEHLFPALPIIFANISQSFDSTHTLALRARFLRRDKTGKGIAEVLNRISKCDLSSESLVDALRLSPEVVVVYARILPALLPKNIGSYAGRILEEWLPFMSEIPQEKRAAISGALVVLSGMLLQKSRQKLSEESLFLSLTKHMRQQSLQINADIDGFWGVFSLGNQQGGGAEDVTAEGAKLIVESMEKMEDERYKPVAVYTALAMNLGLIPMNQVGDELVFDPGQHEDSIGGLIRGKTVIATRPGWRWKDAILLKTQVKLKPDYA